LLVLAGALLLPDCAQANPALPTVRLHLRVQPGLGPPGVPPQATLLLELAWTFDPGRVERRRSMLRPSWDPWGTPDLVLEGAGDPAWLIADDPPLDEPGESP
jgi:hypothetical protein